MNCFVKYHEFTECIAKGFALLLSSNLADEVLKRVIVLIWARYVRIRVVVKSYDWLNMQ